MIEPPSQAERKLLAIGTLLATAATWARVEKQPAVDMWFAIHEIASRPVRVELYEAACARVVARWRSDYRPPLPVDVSDALVVVRREWELHRPGLPAPTLEGTPEQRLAHWEAELARQPDTPFWHEYRQRRALRAKSALEETQDA